MSTNSSQTLVELVDDGGIFKRLFDGMPQLSWTATPDGCIDFYNQGWYEFTGIDFEQAKGRGWESVHHPDFLDTVKKQFDAAFDAGASFELEFPMRRHDGEFEWFMTRVNPLKDDEGNVIRWIGINSNIQSLKDKENLLRSSERRIATMANSLPNFVWSTDRDLNVDFFNDRWYQYTGLTPEDSLGQGWRQCFTEESLKKMGLEWDRAINSKTPYSEEQQIRAKDGQYRWFLTKGYPLLDDNGEIVAWFGTNTDIHEQKKSAEILEKTVAQRTQQLELERDKAIAAHTAKSDFVATVGHEIRNPLSGVIGYLELLIETIESDLSADAKQLASNALSASQSLEKILNDLLDASKLEAGKLKLRRLPFSLSEVTNEVSSLLKAAADKKSLSFQVKVAAGLSSQVIGDELRFRQILINLISNAIKFTNAGFVALNCSAQKNDGKTAVILVEVEDSGIGIAKDQMPLLFKPYSQIESPTSRLSSGSGLGLSICESLVALMGGSISVKSEFGVGSKFSVELPFEIFSESV